MSSRQSSLCLLSSRQNRLTPLDSSALVFGLFHLRSLPSDLSGFIVPPIPLATRYLVSYSEHATLFPPFQIGRVLISGWNWIGLSCLPKAFIYIWPPTLPMVYPHSLEYSYIFKSFFIIPLSTICTKF